jgi:hypothetical protein
MGDIDFGSGGIMLLPPVAPAAIEDLKKALAQKFPVLQTGGWE